MSNHQTITAALLAAFNLDADNADPAAVASAAATVLLAFADAVRGPAPVVGEMASVELVADETPTLILAELRKQNTLLEVLAKQGDRFALCAAPATGAAACGLPD
ncbi:hypothetical protein GJ698_02340 [Pseudoduganella sp. FT26W]|uniref:Uncharacterized protein n=1 Tax=Duganella aquatilis TaxID=2666082 RepID=A0A844D6U4_9BURK|nr:hypothetical protein [Duganella aquatilis]MRW82929.1 hypothetical protein [Duganella aquatilis]